METVDYTISPATVKLVGEKARLDEIDSIVLDTLYVQDLEDSQSLTYTIPVPEDVTIADGRGHRHRDGGGPWCHGADAEPFSRIHL